MPCWKQNILVVAVTSSLVARSRVYFTPRLKRHAMETCLFQKTYVRLEKTLG